MGVDTKIWAPVKDYRGRIVQVRLEGVTNPIGCVVYETVGETKNPGDWIEGFEFFYHIVEKGRLTLQLRKELFDTIFSSATLSEAMRDLYMTRVESKWGLLEVRLSLSAGRPARIDALENPPLGA